MTSSPKTLGCYGSSPSDDAASNRPNSCSPPPTCWYAADLREIVRTRLVQTNVVRRSVALRGGLAAVAERCDLPITLIEVGSSAGIHLRHGAYGYVHNRRRWGDTTSPPVQLDVGWRGSGHLPDLDRVPVQHSVLGIDLNPIDPTDAHEREWLRALVWPENGHEEALLETALRIVASDPPPTVAGDARDVLPGIGPLLGPDAAAVVFHAATRSHVEPADRDGFDAAISGLADGRRLIRLTLETARDDRYAHLGPSYALTLTDHGGSPDTIAVVEPHGRWIQSVGA